MLEPTISNHGQEFLDDWNSKQKQFLLLLMKDIVQFCDKFIGKTTQDIKNTESSLWRNASQNQYDTIQTEINTVQQQKLKKDYNLKYKPESTNHTRVLEEDIPREKTGKAKPT